ncbi:hypothetical protein [Nocardioides sp. SYSU DS0651]|uniref:hypothetical protein n=1 Tax=Nocardioides sp. SYSU DS0651 TaxID=3415955 RepID=UPI003F4B91D0
MTAAPATWFDALQVDPDDVARVGYSLLEYADDHETPRLAQDESTVEGQLMLATTITEAASMLVLLDPAVAVDGLVRAANLYAVVGAPEAWVVGMACGGAWRPPLGGRDAARIDRPSDAMSALAALNAHLEEVDRGRPGVWESAYAFGDNPALGWTATGVPAGMFAEFARRVRQADLERAAGAMDAIIERADEILRTVQETDQRRWQRLSADVSLIDPELLALGCVASRVDSDFVGQVEARDLSPARVAVLAGTRLGGDLTEER